MRRRGESRMLPPRGGGVLRQRGEHALPAGAHGLAPQLRGSVTLVHDRGRDWLAFAYPFDEGLNDEIKRLPGRRFDWDDRRWLVPADRRLGSVLLDIFERYPWLEVSDAVRDWVETFSGWFGEVTASELPTGGPAFAIGTVGGEPPDKLREHAIESEDWLLLPMDLDSLRLIKSFDNVELDQLATECAELLEEGELPPAATLEYDVLVPGEVEFQLHPIWGARVREDFARLPEARVTRERAGEFNVQADARLLSVPADPALALHVAEFLDEHPEVVVA